VTLTDTEFHNLWRARHLTAPQDERAEMDQRLWGHVYDPSRRREFELALPQGMEESAGLAHSLARVEKAVRQENRVRRPEQGAKRQSIFDDPLISWANVQGVLPRMGRIPPQLLRSMARQNPIKQGILQIMTNRTLRHAQYVESGVQAMLEGYEGFDLFPTFKEAHVPLTEGERQEKLAIVNFILNSGHIARISVEDDITREDVRRESFEQTLAHQVKQRFILDARSIEMERTRNRRMLSGLYIVDGATMHRTDPREWPYINSPEAKRNPHAAFVQVWRNQIVTSFGSNDFYYDYANPSDEIGQRGYGMSEVEMSIKLTTGILNVLTSNNAIFDRGALPPGILSINGLISNETLDDIRDEWDAYRLGAGGQWGMPVINLRDPQGKVNFLRTDGNPNEMVFREYVNFLAAIDCAVFGVDVTEVNVSTFGGSNASLSSGKDTQTRIDESKNRSFLPWMQRLETTYNEIVMPFYGNRWRFGWVGLQRQDPEALRKVYMQVATVDEVRQTIFRMRPVGGEAGGSLASNPAVSQMLIASSKEDGGGDLNGDGKKGESKKEG